MIDTHRVELTLFQGSGGAVGYGDEVGDLPAPSSMSLSLDVDRSPYVQASFTIPRPSRAWLTKMDPRTYPIVRVRMLRDAAGVELVPATLADVTTAHSYDSLPADGTIGDLTAEYPGTEITTDFPSSIAPSGATWPLYVTELEEDYAANTVTVTLASGEVRLDDHKRVATTAADMSTVGTLNAIVGNLVARVAGYSDWSGGAWAIGGEPALWQPGDSISGFIDPILEASNLRIYAASAFAYTVATIGQHSTYGGVGHLNLDGTTDVFSAGRKLSTSGGGVGWYDAAVVIYRWTNGAGVAQTVVDRWPASGAHTRARVVQRTTAFPGAGAAAGIVGRSTQRGYTIPITIAAAYDVNPGWTVALQLPDDPAPQTWAVQTVQFDPLAGEMTLNLQAIGA